MNINDVLHDQSVVNLTLMNHAEKCFILFPSDFTNRYKLDRSVSIKQYSNSVVFTVQNRINKEHESIHVPLYLFANLDHKDWSSWAIQATRKFVSPDAGNQSRTIVDLMLRKPEVFVTLTNINFKLDDVKNINSNQDWLFFQDDLETLILGSISHELFLDKWKSK